MSKDSGKVQIMTDMSQKKKKKGITRTVTLRLDTKKHDTRRRDIWKMMSLTLLNKKKTV